MASGTNFENQALSCFLCGSTSVKSARDRRPVDFHKIRQFYKCAACKGFSLWPQLEDWEVQTLYSNNYIGDVNPDSPPDYEANMARFDKLSNYLGKINSSSSKRFLDYGCGGGAEAVILAKNLGFQSFGLEVAPETRKTAQGVSGCEIYSPEELAKGKYKFDFIFLGDILEHVSNPRDVLTKVKESLGDSGSMLVQGPLEGAMTISNFLVATKARLLAGRPSSFPPYHVSLATKRSIMMMIDAQGFKITLREMSEPLWPAPAFGSKESIGSVSKFLLSFAKFLDMLIHKVYGSYGTRFFIIAQKK